MLLGYAIIKSDSFNCDIVTFVTLLPQTELLDFLLGKSSTLDITYRKRSGTGCQRIGQITQEAANTFYVSTKIVLSNIRQYDTQGLLRGYLSS